MQTVFSKQKPRYERLHHDLLQQRPSDLACHSNLNPKPINRSPNQAFVDSSFQIANFPDTFNGSQPYLEVQE